jgi:hypothetical protein
MIYGDREYQYEDGTVRPSWTDLNKSTRNLVLDVVDRLGSDSVLNLVKSFFESYE